MSVNKRIAGSLPKEDCARRNESASFQARLCNTASKFQQKLPSVQVVSLISRNLLRVQSPWHREVTFRVHLSVHIDCPSACACVHCSIFLASDSCWQFVAINQSGRGSVEVVMFVLSAPREISIGNRLAYLLGCWEKQSESSSCSHWTDLSV